MFTDIQIVRYVKIYIYTHTPQICVHTYIQIYTYIFQQQWSLKP